MMIENLSLNALRAFEAAAHRLNFANAGEDLHVSQSAVSRHVQHLEQYLGVRLFVRLPRGLQLTEAGDALAQYTYRIFTDLEKAVGQLSARRYQQSLHIAVARSYATYILARRIDEFCEQYPMVELFLDGMRHLSNLHDGEADAAIRVGEGNWSDLHMDCLGDEELSPVCTPSLLRKYGPLTEPNDLNKFILLHFSEQPQWQAWVDAAGANSVDISKGVQFSETSMMLEAARASQGVAIARLKLVQAELKTGELIRPFRISVKDTQRYYFCATERSMNRPVVKAFRSWLLSLNGASRALTN